MWALTFGSNKEWWLVETDGAGYPRNHGKPVIEDINKLVRLSHQYGAEVLGFYRLWGDYQGQDYNKAYNIWTNPGLNPIPNEDVNGEKYWWNIRTLYEN
jgi:hypothetical protein